MRAPGTAAALVGRTMPTIRIAFATSLVALAAGCAASTDSAEDTSTSAEDLARTTAVSRADEWVAAKLHYCQSPHGEVDGDSACWAWEGPSHRCRRESDGAWNAYRSDCSGLVSWAWELPAPGRTTYGFAPFDESVTRVIEASTLKPGDAVNSADHVMLFEKWITHDQEASFIEEPGCSSAEPYAHRLTSRVSVSGSSIYVDYEGAAFTAIRSRKLP
jgi:hypothetical protein